VKKRCDAAAGGDGDGTAARPTAAGQFRALKPDDRFINAAAEVRRMPGRASDRPVLKIVGAVAFAVAVVGTVAFGWRFGGDSSPTATAIGVGFAAVAVGWTLYSRFA